MLRPGSTEPGSTGKGIRLALAGITLALLAGCSVAGRSGPADPSASVPPAEATARMTAALAQLSSGDEPAAATAFRALLRDYPQYAGPAVNLALIHARRGEEAAALAYLDAAARSCEHCGAVWNELGLIRRRAGRLADAEAAYRQAIAVEPGFGLAYYNLAVLYELYLQRPGDALAAYRQFLGGAPDPQLSVAVTQWVADLERRTQGPATAARSGDET